MADVEEEYRLLAADVGSPLEFKKLPEEEIGYLGGRLPSRLVQFLSQTGQAIYLEGAVTVCRPSELTPILSLIFKADPDLHHDDCTVVSYGAFGLLRIWSQNHGLIKINLPEGIVHSQKLAPTIFREGLLPNLKRKPDPNVVASHAVLSRKEEVDFLDFKGEAMLDRCIAAHGKLSLGECYGFFPALGLTDLEGPMRRVENIRKVPALEHFAILAQLQPFHLANVGPNGIQRIREIG